MLILPAAMSFDLPGSVWARAFYSSEPERLARGSRCPSLGARAPTPHVSSLRSWQPPKPAVTIFPTCPQSPFRDHGSFTEVRYASHHRQGPGAKETTLRRLVHSLST